MAEQAEAEAKEKGKKNSETGEASEAEWKPPELGAETPEQLAERKKTAARLAGILIIKLIAKASLLSNLRPRNAATVKPDRLKPGKIAIP